MEQAAKSSSTWGVSAGIGAFGIWGLAPLYWFFLRHLDSLQVLAHRVLWSALIAIGLLFIVERPRVFLARLQSKSVWYSMLASTALIATNWFVFIYAVTHQRVTDVSLGYYANPLFNVLLAWLLLKEHFSRLQFVAFVLAATGVMYMGLSLGRFPWISLVLATSFSLYGVIRKQASIPALPGLVIETSLVTPFCVAYLVWSGPLAGLKQTSDLIWLIGGGLLTATPLLLFGVGARRIKYSTMGMIQYLAPSLQLGCAVLLLGEPFTTKHAITFALIWSAVLLYLFALWRAPRAMALSPPASAKA